MAHRWRSPSASSIYPCWLSRSRPHCAPPACPQLKPCAWSTEMRPSVDDHIVQARRLRKVYRGANEVEALRGIDLEVDRQDLSTMSDRTRTAYRRDHMGFVFQAFNLLPVLSAVENVEIPLLLQNLSSRDSRRRALEMLETLGLAHRANHRPDQLSGGEQQRVAVARALVHKPAVVWADEPTGNLDTEVTYVITELLVKTNREGQTIVLVTHNPQVAERASRVIRMRDGRIQNAAPAGIEGAAT